MGHFSGAVALVLFLLFAPFARAQNDCTDAIVVCGNTGFQGLTVSGIGNQEIDFLNTCGSQENNSIWLKLPVATTGTLAFTLTPGTMDLEEDFDFFIFGPNVTCDDLGMAIRCSTTNPLMAGQFDNLTGMNSAETDTSEGPGELGNSFVQALDVVAGETYFIVVDRPIGNANFSIQWDGSATFEMQPNIAAPPNNLQTCVPSGNTGVFNLNENFNVIVGGQPNVHLTYHTNANDAITGSNQIFAPTIFNNTNNPQTIYARLTNTTSGCFSLTDFTLTVTNGAALSADSFSLCDDAADGDGTNAQTVFDLDVVTQTLLSGQNTAGLNVAYFGSALAAQSNTGALGTTFYNTIPNQQDIYVRISNTTGCVLVEPVHLRVWPRPAVVHTTLAHCDTGLVPDGLTQFDLSQAIGALTGGNSNLEVAFFEAGSTTPITASLYDNLSNPQTLQARIRNSATGCQSWGSVTLVGNIVPPPTISIAPECDVLGVENGLATFDLTTTNIVLTATQSVAFYATEQDALLAQNPIGNPSMHQNIVPYNDVVYVRIDDSGQCASISTLALKVNRLPDVERLASGGYVCNDNPDLTVTLDAGILSGTPSDYTYRWFRNGQDLGQTSYTITVNQAGDYTVEVTRLGCTVTRTVTVLESAPAYIESVIIDDLDTDYPMVTVNISTVSLGDYVFALDTPQGPFQSSPVFANVDPGIHDLYIKDLLACGVLGPIQVNVLGVPHYFTPNGDGFNDTWNIKGVDGNHYSKTIIRIFDRNGKLIKHISPLSAGWDGNYQGQPLPADDYWYIMELEDARTAKGHFSLKR
ncbi:T9SS type B sorting domain-containing protein [Flavobacterium caeni]|uniref:Gliding motility-associated C-terminal domain-containing protein n=1 Tax=Flavobacterium caeni TaxID=490189 RepID=A0A1G5APT4_9FLAO|nr:T9SS type B sorting domain-containing protein [Flavobacterium caeni]SCX79852.1 gliding motility-associated C-terminal domain-containing protein [Flavobacterium caeni]